MPKPDFDIIGPYRVVRTLGQGGMGTVYHGVHHKTQEPVAIKVIAASMAQHQRFRRRFDAEIQTLLKLKHPGIVQLIGFGEEKGLLFYSMEYVDGENLQQQLQHQKQIPWERVLDIAIEVCAALKHAHDFGIIHRDLKPANLMINTQGKVKLTDFGIAKLFGASDATVEGSVLGTADFMAPEQAEGKPVTVRSDLYALGSVCYAALAGRTPFHGKNVPEVLFNVRYGTLTPLASIVPQVPSELCDLVEELLQREPSLRPPTGLVVGNRFQALKMGLASRAKKNPPTIDASQLKELTSIDLEVLPSIVDPPTVSQNQTVILQGRAPQLTSLSSDEVMKSQPPLAGPHDKTHIQHSLSDVDDPILSSSQAMEDRPSGIDFMGKTNFTEVQADDRRRSTVLTANHEETTPWGQWVGIAVLSIALLSCIAVLFWLLRVPSANQLYSEISHAIESNEDEQWLAAEPAAQRFKELYPDDTRIQDVDATLQEIDSIRSVRQLQRKARRGNIEELSAIEQAFLECLEAQSLGSDSYNLKLQAFLTLFGSQADLDEKSKRWVAQIRRMLEQLNSSQKRVTNEASRSLKEQMDWADANLTGAIKRKWLQAMVELFEGKPWAKELVDRAKKELTVTDTNK